MKILIAGTDEKTTNYQKALENLNVDYTVSLAHLTTSTNTYSGLLLPGGDDIHPSFFGEQNNGSRICNPQLDLMQSELLELFVEQKLPVFGICKGFQMINVFFGGTIQQHLYERSLHHEYQNGDVFHHTTCTQDNLLSTLYGTSFVTNSAHHQAIHKIGKNLSILQYSDDNVVEAISHNTLPILGVQWHPERICFDLLKDNVCDGSIILRYFLSLCH